MNWFETLVVVASGLLLLYAALLLILWRYARTHPDTVSARDALLLLPDVVRLVRRLIVDPTVPKGVRLRLVLLLGYLIIPLDLIPDFIPVIGWADDVIIVALILRFTIRSAGEEALKRHWRGTPAGLRAIQSLAAPARSSASDVHRDQGAAR
jgi:uncharacterized membrane protein YkvA (DUF1232 family)